MTYGEIQAFIEDETDATENAAFQFRLFEMGTARENLRIASNQITFNNSERNVDVLIKSDDGSTNFFSDATNNRIGIGTNSPTANLDVHGTILANPTGTYAATVGSGSDTSTTAGVVFDGDADLFRESNGYLRRIIGASSATLTIGQDGTSIWNTIDLIPDTAVKSGCTPITPDAATNSAELTMTIDDAKVGIGTTSPNQKLTVEGTMSLKEQASANADTAAYGQLWVKTATPNELYFTTDAGDDIQITSGTSLAETGDIQGVTAGTGISGGGTSGRSPSIWT